ncbi:MAG TPA: chromate efflux transporter [Gammaproteobacteria bacterium]|nr:chromate efflux transporter [Gammaproteobacteria bacterium]
MHPNLSNEPTLERPAPPSFGEAFLYWLKLGFISFGGPAGQISMMHQELVEKRRWISERRFLHALNYCMLLPGPEAQQLAIYIGWMLHRSWGGIVAGTLFLLPSLFILAALTYIYLAYGDLAFVQGVFNGIKPAGVAIVLFAAWRIGSRALKNEVLWILAAAAFLAIFVFNVPFPYIVLGAGLLGFFGGKLMPGKFAVGGGHGASGKSYGPAVIDDDTTPPAHTRFRPVRLLVLLVLFIALWLAAMALLLEPELRTMGEFFTKAALVTFGGAYAVLPYVYQGGVETHGWLTGPQMMDGLALGETTPGPLIMVVAFVGFVGAWTKEIFGPDMLLLAGFTGAVVATFFTFLPSYLFILAGAPLVEATHGDLRFTAPLSGITAAVVGVILNLALFFGWHVLWPQGTADAPFAGDFEWFQALVALAAFIALWRYKVDILKVIGACALVGLGYAWVGG